MPREKPRPKPTRRPARVPEPHERMRAERLDVGARISLLTFKASAAYAAWFERLTKFSREQRGPESKTALLDRGLMLVARELGFDEPPPVR